MLWLRTAVQQRQHTGLDRRVPLKSRFRKMGRMAACRRQLVTFVWNSQFRQVHVRQRNTVFENAPIPYPD